MGVHAVVSKPEAIQEIGVLLQKIFSRSVSQ
jgi:hypothetical protein